MGRNEIKRIIYFMKTKTLCFTLQFTIYAACLWGLIKASTILGNDLTFFERMAAGGWVFMLPYFGWAFFAFIFRHNKISLVILCPAALIAIAIATSSTYPLLELVMPFYQFIFMGGAAILATVIENKCNKTSSS